MNFVITGSFPKISQDALLDLVASKLPPAKPKKAKQTTK